jgi:hypothetical protein
MDLDLTDIGNIPVGFAIVIITMVVMAVLLFWVFKQKQWIVLRDHDNGDNVKQKNKDNESNGSIRDKIKA